MATLHVIIRLLEKIDLKMDRKEFLAKAGMGAFMALTVGCMGACTKMDNPKPPVDPKDNPNTNEGGPLHLEIDLTKAEYADLLIPGKYVIVQNNWVIAFTTDEEYIAASRLCKDANLKGIVWGGSEWVCVEHQATYDTAGDGTTTHNNLGMVGLDVYTTELIGDILHITE